MPRPPRLLFAGGTYHVIARGNNKMQLFHDKQDFRFYRKLWRQTKEKLQLQIYRWCFMSNHIHFIVNQTNQNDLPEAMHYIQQRYAKYYGRRYRWTGHVWQGRYTSRLIADDAYLFQCGEYVENNPVRAGIVCRSEDYPWSSAYGRTRGFDDGLTSPCPFASDGRTVKNKASPIERNNDPWKNGRRVLGSAEAIEKLIPILGNSALIRSGRPSRK